MIRRAIPVLCLAFVCLALVLATSPLAAQDTPSGDSAALGAIDFESSAPPEARKPFLQGLAALHSFFYDEAAELFRQAQDAAPDFAMAYWGEALTHNHPLWRQQDRKAARAILERLAPTPEERAAKAGTERERAYLQSVEILYGEGPKAERDKEYSEALKRLAAQWPKDLDASALYALSLQGLLRDDTWGMQDRMRSAAILEPLFDRNPDHPGVLHYLIHAYDDPIHAPLGLRPAVLYARVAPAAHHALHMPSHIFLQLGMWDRVVSSNLDAYKASMNWVSRRDHSHAKQDFHSLSWLHYGYLQQGRYLDADLAFAAIEAVREETDDPVVYRYRNSMAARRALESRQWESASWKHLEVPREAAADGPVGGSFALMVFVNGLAAAEKGDLEAARAAHVRLIERLEGLDDPGSESEILARELEGRILIADGRTDEGLALLQEATEMETKMGLPSGPVDPMKPAYELYGEMLLALDRPEEAFESFEHALQRTPNRVLSLLGSARAAAAKGDRATARDRYAALAAIWRKADPGLPMVAEAKSFLSGDQAVGM